MGICPGLRQPRRPTGLPDMWQDTQENETWLVTLLSCFSVLVRGQFRKVSRWINVSAFILYVVLYKKIKLQSYDRLLKKHANSWLAFSKTHFLPGIQLKKENYCISNALYFRISLAASDSVAVMKSAFLIQILQYILFHNKFIRHFFHILSKCHCAAELYLPINLELLFHLKHLNMYNFKYWRNIDWFQ